MFHGILYFFASIISKDIFRKKTKITIATELYIIMKNFKSFSLLVSKSCCNIQSGNCAFVPDKSG